MYDFKYTGWSDEIAKVSTRDEYMRAEVRITVLPEGGTKGTYNAKTNTWDGGTPVIELYRNRARLVRNFRESMSRRNTHIYNAGTETRIFVHLLPEESPDEMIPNGALVTILDIPRNSGFLVGESLRVISDFSGSESASRTLETERSSEFRGGD